MAEAFNLDAKTGGFDIAGKPANFSAIILKFPVRAQMAAAPYHFIVPQSVGAAAATRGRMRRRKHLNKLQLQWINPPLDKPWVRLFIDVLELKAWRNLSVNARRIHDALTCWYFRNHQQENGQIKISYRQFERSGVARNSIAGAIRELNDAGFIAIKHGEPSKDVMTPPSLYRLCVYDKAESDGLQKTASRLFAFMPIDVIESPLWCGLSINARRILEHLLIMNIGLWSEQNGKLRVSVREFAKHGVGRRFTAGAVKELINAGLLAVTKGKARGSQRPPNFYRLTFLGTIDNPATWKPVESDAAEPSKPAGRKTEPMPIQKIFTAPQRCAGTAPKGAPVKAIHRA
jgi:hypothetical protein